jgi:hypothetical protein
MESLIPQLILRGAVQIDEPFGLGGFLLFMGSAGRGRWLGALSEA